MVIYIAVHIREGEIYSRDQKKLFRVRIVRGSVKRGLKPAKSAREDRRVFSNRCVIVLIKVFVQWDSTASDR